MRLTHAFLLIVSAFVFIGCATAPRTAVDRASLVDEADVALTTMKAQDPTMEPFLEGSYGHVIFPYVGKGGLVVGGAYGRGVVYEQGRHVGFADVTKADIGLQAGGQAFSQVIAFENSAALEEFKYGKMKFNANASAVALKSGAAAGAKYTDGVAVFVQPLGGLMFEASIGGQSFSFVPN